MPEASTSPLVRPIGLGLAARGSVSDVVAWSERAGAAGLDSVWIHDSYFERDAVTYASAIASQVEGIRVAMGAVNPFTRHPVVLAMTVSALDEMAQDRVVNCENRIVEVDDEHVMATIGYSTPTPWETPRERTDDEIGDLIEKLMAEVPDPSRCVLNFHCPPLDSGLDTCMKLDASVWPPAPIVEHGQPVYYGAGSRSVTEALERYQPTVGLHGHIHESRGSARFGRTIAFNPGSEYGEGVLRGLIVAVREGQLIGHQFTSG